MDANRYSYDVRLVIERNSVRGNYEGNTLTRDGQYPSTGAHVELIGFGGLLFVLSSVFFDDLALRKRRFFQRRSRANATHWFKFAFGVRHCQRKYLLERIETVYKIVLHVLYTITTTCCAPSLPRVVHHHYHVLYTITTTCCTPSLPRVVHHHHHVLYTITTTCCTPSLPRVVHHHYHYLFSYTGFVCVTYRVNFSCPLFHIVLYLDNSHSTWIVPGIFQISVGSSNHPFYSKLLFLKLKLTWANVLCCA